MYIYIYIYYNSYNIVIVYKYIVYIIIHNIKLTVCSLFFVITIIISDIDYNFPNRIAVRNVIPILKY